MIMVGTLKSRYIRDLVKAKKIDASLLEGKNEKYLMTVVSAPLNGVDEALVIVGSDKRERFMGFMSFRSRLGFRRGTTGRMCGDVGRIFRWRVEVIRQENRR